MSNHLKLYGREQLLQQRRNLKLTKISRLFLRPQTGRPQTRHCVTRFPPSSTYTLLLVEAASWKMLLLSPYAQQGQNLPVGQVLISRLNSQDAASDMGITA